MNRKIKKIAISLGALSMVAAPVITAVSCGGGEVKKETKSEMQDRIIGARDMLIYFEKKIITSPIGFDTNNQWYGVSKDLSKELDTWIFSHDENNKPNSNLAVLVDDMKDFLNPIGKMLIQYMMPNLIPVNLKSLVAKNPIWTPPKPDMGLADSLKDIFSNSIAAYKNILSHYMA